ncbi:MAG: carboxylesterase family protein, partial [Synergistaceae bacterium]|nr:carboxylesterase family protein [Synergistaceae bacterium]
VADLQKVDVEKLVKASAIIGGMRIGPERDGKYLPLEPYEAYTNGAAKDIDTMQGCNKDELNYFMVAVRGIEPFTAMIANRMAKNLAQLTDEEKAKVDSFYNDIQGETYEKICRLYDQAWFIAPLITLSENQTKAGGKSYTYYFMVESLVPLMKNGHAVELATVFNHPEDIQCTGRAFDETFSKTLRKMWVQFAKNGNPSLSTDTSPDGNAKNWPVYDFESK